MNAECAVRLSSSSVSEAICVLGCPSGSAALARRTRAARDVYAAHEGGDASSSAHILIIACGGLEWGGHVEADVIARMLKAAGVPADVIVRERRSRDTHENATYAAEILRARGIEDVVVVTCSWHLPRARRSFERAGLRVTRGVGVPPPNPTLASRVWWVVRERVALVKDLLRQTLGQAWR